MLAVNPKKILLAEDDRDDQKLFCDFLKHRTDIVLLPVADNGIVLFDMLASIPDSTGLPDLIILDHNMPRRNGLQTLKLLKDNERYAHIPVVIYSTYTDKQLVDACAEKGACSVLPKPITKDGYSEMIDTVLLELPKV
jgi:CheY-like chemotaxis protein